MILGLLPSALFAQYNVDSWKSHFSYEENVSKVEDGDKYVYALSDKKLFAYDKTTGEYITPLKASNEKDILNIAYCPQAKSLLILRDDFNFDVLNELNTLIPISSFDGFVKMKSPIQNSISMDQSSAYVATNFGIIIIDMLQSGVKNVCYFDTPVYFVMSFENKLYASTGKGFLSISTSGNINDQSEWTAVNASSKYSFPDYTFSDTEIRDLAVFNNKLYFLIPNKALYYFENDNSINRTMQGSAPTNLSNRFNTDLVAHRATTLWRVLDSGSYSYQNTSGLLGASASSSESIWVSYSGTGLTEVKFDKNNPTTEVLRSGIKPVGPYSNYPFFMNSDRGKIRVVGGGYEDNNFNTGPQLSEFDGSAWFQFPKPKVAGKDFVCVVSDPQDVDHVFVASYGKGIYEYKNRVCDTLYNSKNSSLSDIFPPGQNYTRLDGLAFDKNGRLWTAQTSVDSLISVFDKPATPDGFRKSKAFRYPEMASWGNTIPKTMAVDEYNNKWLGTWRAYPIIFIFNENNTIDDTSDDKIKLLSNIVSDDGYKLSPYKIASLVPDKTGKMWVATDVGLYYIEISEDIFDREVTLKIPLIRDEVSGHVSSKLFSNLKISNLVIDKGNRKWVAINGGGVYLVNADNEIVKHFTQSNSPLPSNNVLSIAVDDNSNTVYIGTNKGIVSAKYEEPEVFQNTRSVEIYPSAISVLGNRNLTISGVKENSYVKISDNKGNLVSDGFAEGNTFVWNLKNKQGVKVLPGVYYVYGKNESGGIGLLGSVNVTNLKE